MGIDLRLARVRKRVLDLMRTTRLEEVVGLAYLYSSVHDGVNAFMAEDQGDAEEPRI